MTATKTRRRRKAKPMPAHWVISTELHLPNRSPLTDGVEFSLKGHSAASRRWVFRRHVLNTVTGEEWVTGRNPMGHTGSIPIDRIGRVHRNRKVEYLERKL